MHFPVSMFYFFIISFMWKGKYISRVLALVSSLMMIGLVMLFTSETFFLLVPLIMYAGGVMVLLVYVCTSAIDSQETSWIGWPLLLFPLMCEKMDLPFFFGGGVSGGLLVLLTILVLLALFFYQPFLSGAVRYVVKLNWNCFIVDEEMLFVRHSEISKMLTFVWLYFSNNSTGSSSF